MNVSTISAYYSCLLCFFFRVEGGIRVRDVTGVQTCALPIFGVRRAVPTQKRPKVRVLPLSQRKKRLLHLVKASKKKTQRRLRKRHQNQLQKRWKEKKEQRKKFPRVINANTLILNRKLKKVIHFQVSMNMKFA